MPPARSGIRNLTEKYLKCHPAEREQLKPLLAALEADAEPTSRERCCPGTSRAALW
ncbi:hypothetical protein [Streptomyces sp. NPDC005131]